MLPSGRNGFPVGENAIPAGRNGFSRRKKARWLENQWVGERNEAIGDRKTKIEDGGWQETKDQRSEIR